MRLDKFLKVSRVIKRRGLAKEACDAGIIKVNGVPAKPSKKIKEGDIVEIDAARFYLKFRIVQVPSGNVRKSEAHNLFEVIEERRKSWEE
ncbi:RNA-binding S4 domain protein [Thermosulfidibacter takaii ABI70S6]|uniref:RQC P-site tRNA stabilizing factor n=1 Tax=Thermosulfidibacter takaii (strain DSM 17441 / JCM 13301 / NBRC 103674 / ABI70S6) TaxID=1298851 RepID=A0A0S3QUQ2_THET7|nr:RNA-binding S4 domain protein [Thermosulfidibacter takaii ABI70S6]